MPSPRATGSRNLRSGTGGAGSRRRGRGRPASRHRRSRSGGCAARSRWRRSSWRRSGSSSGGPTITRLCGCPTATTARRRRSRPRGSCAARSRPPARTGLDAELARAARRAAGRRRSGPALHKERRDLRRLEVEQFEDLLARELRGSDDRRRLRQRPSDDELVLERVAARHRFRPAPCADIVERHDQRARHAGRHEVARAVEHVQVLGAREMGEADGEVDELTGEAAPKPARPEARGGMAKRLDVDAVELSSAARRPLIARLVPVPLSSRPVSSRPTRTRCPVAEATGAGAYGRCRADQRS